FFLNWSLVVSALKRSFEVEEVDSSSSSSPLSRRSTNPLRSSGSSTSGQRLHDPGTRSSEVSSSTSQRSPKSSLQRLDFTSRRAELAIDVSSKQVDISPSPGIARFGLRRPESRSAEPAARRAEPALNRRADLSSRIPEPSQRRAEPPGPPREADWHLSGTLADRDSNRQPSDNGAASLTARPPLPECTRRMWPVGEAISSFTSFSSSSSSSSSRSSMTESAAPASVAAAAYDEKPVVDFSYVGIDAILEQMRRKAMKQGFELNIMVVGQSGLGKSTLMNTLFKSKVSRKSVLGTSEERIPKTIEIKSISHDVEEKGVRMKLTVIDTPGFGDQINNENCWRPIMQFINAQYERYLQEELNINRKKRIPDSRIHCCIYFIPPTGHSLRPLDVEFMRRLSKVVNIVPVIAKADTLTLEERDLFKKNIRDDLRTNSIDIYPQKEFDEDSEDRMINEKIREMIPFAVVGSDLEYQVNGRRILGRKTKWGTIEVENITHCEFAYLRDLLIRTHMQNIKDITSSIHYEMYRVRRLNENNTQSNGVTEHHFTSHEL
uniref:Septin-type G domain-containing protein n=1 Tax=Denticeps clupeoides TaxID=299321 RepID=A0AAY4B5H6_9TELE